MLYWLADFSDKFSFLNVFRYITFPHRRRDGDGVRLPVFVFLFGP